LLIKETAVASDYFLKLDPKIEGESTDSKHKGEIELESFSYGVSNQSSSLQGGGGGAGKSEPGPLIVTKRNDKATARLHQAVAMGDHFKTAILTIRKAGGTQQEYLTVTLNDVYISNFQISGANGGGLPMESIAFNYAKLVQEYKEQKADGTLGGAVKLGYDWAKQVKV
jgi:type VI secretion system secreted protein Hcp